MEAHLSPIALFAYNRPEVLRRTLEGLKRNPEIDQTTLYVFTDGPKREEDISKVNEVREIAASVAFCKVVRLIASEKNRGLAGSILSGVSLILEEHDSLIVMEDDLVVTPGFLRYMNDALRLYRDHERVIGISGYMLPVAEKLPETFFIRGADCLGWATWRRGWALLEKDPKRLFQQLSDQKLLNEFNYDGTYPYSEMLQAQFSGSLKSWAILWHGTAYLKDKLTLYPHRSLVSHIGMEGTNYSSEPFFDKVNLTDDVQVKPIPVEQSRPAREAIIHFLSERKKYMEKGSSKSFFARILSRFS